jgi:uncharacterized protein Usg
MSDMQKMLQDYRLTTAEILYHMPDHPTLLQSYLWQEYDMAPDFPELQKFLEFWERKLEGPLHSVTIASCELIRPSEFHAPNGEFRVH